MASLILRLIKGSPLTNAEVDGNFTALNNELATKITASSADTLTNKVLDDISNEIGANHIHFKVKATENLVAGDVVKVTGYNSGENAYEVAKMTAATDVAIGIIDGTIAIGGFGAVVNTGLLEGFDTSAFTVGQILYPNGTGGLTATQPSSGAYQAIAFVLRSHAINGAALVEASEPTAVRTSSNTGNTVVLRDASGNFSAGTITAALSGNASTATSAGKWTTARTLSFTGDATGSGSVDGSANVATSLTLSNSGVTAGVYGGNNAIPSITFDAKGRATSAGTVTPSGTWGISISGNAATATYADNAGLLDSLDSSDFARAFPRQGGADLNNFLTAGSYGVNYDNANRPGDWGGVLVAKSSDVIAQWYGDHENNFWVRGGNPPNAGGGGVWNSWQKLLHSGNYSSYALPLSGGTISGVVSYTGDNYTRFGPNSSWGAYLRVGGNGRVSTTDATVATTNGNLHLDSTNGSNIYLNFYAGGTVYGPGGVTMLHSGNYNSYALPLSGGTVNGGLVVDGGTSNQTNDATLYVTAANSNDWGIRVGKSSADYGMTMELGAGSSYGLRVLFAGSERLRIGDSSQTISDNQILHAGNYTSYAVRQDYNTSLNSDTRNTRGVTRLYRRDDNSDYSVQTYWTGSYWRLYGYNGDTGHADTHVGYADSAGSASSASTSSQVTINYNNDSNSTYQMLWGSGNSVYGTGSIYCNPYTDYLYSGSFYCSNWFRSSGSTGWYSETHGGGIYMTDATWVRTYNSKAFYVANEIAATGNITAYYSDMRLKTKVGGIENALDKVDSLEGFYYVENELAKSFGYKNDKQQVALSAQAVKAVMPEAVSLAAFDMETHETTGEITSKSGEEYLTVDYARLVPLLVEAIKELRAEVKALKG